MVRRAAKKNFFGENSRSAQQLVSITKALTEFISMMLIIIGVATRRFWFPFVNCLFGVNTLMNQAGELSINYAKLWALPMKKLARDASHENSPPRLITNYVPKEQRSNSIYSHPIQWIAQHPVVHCIEASEIEPIGSITFFCYPFTTQSTVDHSSEPHKWLIT